MDLSSPFAVVADIHGNIRALEAVLEDIKNRGINHILNIGDSLYGPLAPRETYERIMQYNMISISGNEDRIIWENDHDNETLKFVRGSLDNNAIEWLRNLPKIRELDIGLVMFHGTPRSDEKYLLQKVNANGIQNRTAKGISIILSDYSSTLYLCAHDHCPGSIMLENGALVVNPGSVGLQAYTDDTPHPHKIENGSPHARYAIISQDEAGWYVNFIIVEYDWEKAARMADKNARPDWAFWLKKGLAE